MSKSLVPRFSLRTTLISITLFACCLVGYRQWWLRQPAHDVSIVNNEWRGPLYTLRRDKTKHMHYLSAFGATVRGEPVTCIILHRRFEKIREGMLQNHPLKILWTLDNSGAVTIHGRRFPPVKGKCRICVMDDYHDPQVLYFDERDVDQWINHKTMTWHMKDNAELRHFWNNVIYKQLPNVTPILDAT